MSGVRIVRADELKVGDYLYAGLSWGKKYGWEFKGNEFARIKTITPMMIPCTLEGGRVVQTRGMSIETWSGWSTMKCNPEAVGVRSP